MKFGAALEAMRVGAAVGVGAMPGAMMFIGRANDGQAALCMRAANGKVVAPWFPSLDHLLADDWITVAGQPPAVSPADMKGAP